MPGPPGGNGGTIPSIFHKHPSQKDSVNSLTYLEEGAGSLEVLRNPWVLSEIA